MISIIFLQRQYQHSQDQARISHDTDRRSSNAAERAPAGVTETEGSQHNEAAGIEAIMGYEQVAMRLAYMLCSGADKYKVPVRPGGWISVTDLSETSVFGNRLTGSLDQTWKNSNTLSIEDPDADLRSSGDATLEWTATTRLR